MTKEKMKKFKKIFEAQRKAILFNDRIMREDFEVCADDRYDEIDQATTDMEQSMRMRLRNRERCLITREDIGRSSCATTDLWIGSIAGRKRWWVCRCTAGTETCGNNRTNGLLKVAASDHCVDAATALLEESVMFPDSR